MSGDSRSTSGQDAEGLALKHLALDLRILGLFGKALAAPVTPKSGEGSQAFVKTLSCPGPAGLWPCALEFSHEGDHVARVPSSRVAEKVAEAMRRSDAGLCGFCGGEVNDEDGRCAARCGEEA